MSNNKPLGSDESRLEFPDVSGGAASNYAASLAKAVAALDPTARVAIQRKDPNTQDAGSILTIILGSAPAAALATGIAAWIRKNRVTVRWTTQKESLDISGNADAAAKIVAAISRKN
jgi:hypothetical protein